MECALCSKPLDEPSPEELAEMEAEAFELWGLEASRASECPRVCDDCFHNAHPSDHPDIYARTLEKLHGGKPTN